MELKKVRDEPLTLILDLPDECTAGRWEAAVAFAEAFAELRQQYPDKRFQLLPFQHQTYEYRSGSESALTSVLATEI